MNSYLLIILSDILLTVDFACKKVYQKKAGIGAYAGISFNSVSGFVLTITFWAVNGFTIGFSYYSFIMAAVMTVLSSAYTIIGFRVLKIGGMSFYTLFLMTGGMIVPYIWGVLFLNEQSNLMKAIGIILIILAIFISNTSGSKIDKKLSIFCVAVFFLNGFVSIFSKMHQVNTAYERVDATEFIFWIGIMRFIICGMVLQFVKRQNVNVEKPNIKTVLPIIIFSAVFNGTAYMCQLIGATSVPATVLYPLITGGVVILSSIIGCIAFKEKLSMRQWIGVGICFIGTCLFL